MSGGLRRPPGFPEHPLHFLVGLQDQPDIVFAVERFKLPHLRQGQYFTGLDLFHKAASLLVVDSPQYLLPKIDDPAVACLRHFVIPADSVY